MSQQSSYVEASNTPPPLPPRPAHVPESIASSPHVANVENEHINTHFLEQDERPRLVEDPVDISTRTNGNYTHETVWISTII
jgi:hypothetical protein